MKRVRVLGLCQSFSESVRRWGVREGVIGKGKWENWKENYEVSWVLELLHFMEGTEF